MLICMKLGREERENLTHQIRQAWQRSELSVSMLAKSSEVDAGQASRILEGKFKTLSGNVVQICKILAIDPHEVVTKRLTPDQAKTRAAWARLEGSVRRAWDNTPQGAELLARVIDAVAKVRDG
jgi:hypothetical protein